MNSFLRNILIVSLSLFCVNMEAQHIANDKENTAFRLKNGFSFHGKILHFDEYTLKIEKEDGSILTIKHEDIMVLQKGNEHEKHTFLILSDRPWIGQFQLVTGFGGQTGSFLSVLGINAGILGRIHRSKSGRHTQFLKLYSGIEAYHGFDDAMIIPCVVSVQWNIVRNKISPFLFSSAGWGFNITKNEYSEFPQNSTYMGGGRWEVGGGVTLKSGEVGIDLSIAYSFQKVASSFSSPWWSSEITQEFQRIVIKSGVNF